MTGNYLVDTNVFVRLLRHDPAVEAKLRSLQGICICVHALGELYEGARRSLRATHNVGEVTNLLASARFIPSDIETADQYGLLKAALSAQGTPLPENDVWIAATALRHNLVLVTNDAHFDAIPHLTKERW